MPQVLEAILQGYAATEVVGGESGGKVYRFSGEGRRTLFLKYGSGRIAGDILGELVRLQWLNQATPVTARPRIWR